MSELRNHVRPTTAPLGELDELDEQILSLLEADGRRSAADIARAVGSTRATIHRRIERLVDEQLITIRAFAISRNIGLPLHLIFTLRVAFEHLSSVARAVTAFKELRWVAVTSGSSNLMAEGYFISTDHLHRFVSCRLAPLPGILELETLNVLSLEKFAFDWTTIRHAHEDYDASTPETPSVREVASV